MSFRLELNEYEKVSVELLESLSELIEELLEKNYKSDFDVSLQASNFFLKRTTLITFNNCKYFFRMVY